MNPRVDLIAASLLALDEHPADVLVLTAFADERPLPGLAGLVDWRLNGRLSDWMLGGFATGQTHEKVLCPTQGRLPQPLVLIIGLGLKSQHRADRARSVAIEAACTVRDLGKRTMACGLFGLDRLPTPVERSLPELIQTLKTQAELEAITLSVPEQ